MRDDIDRKIEHDFGNERQLRNLVLIMNDIRHILYDMSSSNNECEYTWHYPKLK